MKTSLVIIALALLACIAWLVWLGSRRDDANETVAESVLDTSQGPAFEVRVIVPRLARPLGGILPDWLVGKLDGTPSELRFDQASRGAMIDTVGHDRLELAPTAGTSSSRQTAKGGSLQGRASCSRWLLEDGT